MVGLGCFSPLQLKYVLLLNSEIKCMGAVDDDAHHFFGGVCGVEGLPGRGGRLRRNDEFVALGERSELAEVFGAHVGDVVAHEAYRVFAGFSSRVCAAQ